MGSNLRTAVVVILAGLFVAATVLIAACGDDGLTTPTSSSGVCEDPVGGSVSGSHGHQGARLCRGDLEATNTITIPLTPLEQDHLHTLTLTAEQVQFVYQGVAVTVASSRTSGHTHVVEFYKP